MHVSSARAIMTHCLAEENGDCERNRQSKHVYSAAKPLTFDLNSKFVSAYLVLLYHKNILTETFAGGIFAVFFNV